MELPPHVLTLREVANRARRQKSRLNGRTRSQRIQKEKALRAVYIHTLQKSHSSLSDRIRELRRLILTEGVPPESEREAQGNRGAWGGACSLRGVLWKIMLGAIHLDADMYCSLISEGPTWKDEDICNDIFRVFQGNEQFKERVPDEKMARVLNAFVRLNFEPGNDSETRRIHPSDPDSALITSYVQPMSAIVAPLLFVMPEPDAFYAFNTLVTRHCPQYAAPDLQGGMLAVEFVLRCLEFVDPQLSQYLIGKGTRSWPMRTIVMQAALSFSAVIPPLSEVVKVWDMLIAFGMHANVFVITAQLVLLRGALLKDPNPLNRLQTRSIPPMDAQLVVPVALKIANIIPDALFTEIAAHPFITSQQLARIDVRHEDDRRVETPKSTRRRRRN
eukprot:scaffold1085_cov252-Pinguiococcus_pyrenoidosus.AAC.15